MVLITNENTSSERKKKSNDFMFRMDSGVVGSIDTLERIGAPTIVVTVLRGITNFSSVIRNAKRRVKGYFFETLKVGPHAAHVEEITILIFRDFNFSFPTKR